MEQHTGSQYDDDLTVGMDEYDDSLHTGNVDLFEFVGDKESSISRLKSIVLSLDWEISDDILRQFNMELLDLKDIWANEKINLVYVQALEKIGRYIFKNKANSNPNAIKLLLRFYSNLEKIVSSESMTEEEKKHLLVEDVEKFEKFKKQISRAPEESGYKKTITDSPLHVAPAFQSNDLLPTNAEIEEPLLNLKAIIFGMDWEISDNDLINLGEEVRNLEKRFSNSKAKLILLQGLGSLGAYINLKRSNAHADAFKLLHSFFLSLEHIVTYGLTGEEEKKVLMPEVEKFNAFKLVVAPTLSPETIAADDESDDEDHYSDYPAADDDISPAFADIPEDIHGFQEEESKSLGDETKQKVDGQIDKFFDSEKPQENVDVDDVKMLGRNKSELIDEMETRLDGFFGEDSTLAEIGGINQEVALQGVDVETEADDDSGEESLPLKDKELAPALFALEGEPEEEILKEEDSLGIDGRLDEFFGNDSESEPEGDVSHLVDIPFLSEKYKEGRLGLGEDTVVEEKGEAESSFIIEERITEDQLDVPVEITQTQTMEDISKALQGAEVETEADDDSGEESLPFMDKELAPALFAFEDVREEGEIEKEMPQEEESLGIDGRLDEFFGDDSEGKPEGDELVVVQGPSSGKEEKLPEEDVFLDEDVAPSLFSVEVGGDEDMTEPVVIQEEPESEMFELSESSVSQDSEQVSSGPVIEIVCEDINIEAAEEFDEAIPPPPPQNPEQAFSSSGDEESFIAEKEDDGLQAKDVPVDLGDHLKEFFEEEAEGFEINKEPVVELSEAEDETGSDISSASADIFTPVDEERQTELISDAEEEPAEELVASVKDEHSEPLTVLQEDEDFIEYIEGVEFDSEEQKQETVFDSAGDTEEVIFEAVDEDDIAEIEAEGHIFFDDVEEELEKYLAERDGISAELGEQSKKSDKDDEYFGSPNISSESAEEYQGTFGSEIRMGAPKPEEFGQIETETGKGFYSEIDFSSMKGDDQLSPLRNCVASLGLEISDSVMESLFDEINKLNILWMTNPIEKSFLQLLFTVAQHIHDYRHEASPESHGLLISIFNKLELSRLAGSEITAVQEDLLSETSKILLWQQKMLKREAMKQEDESSTPFNFGEHDTQHPFFSQEDHLEKMPGREHGAVLSENALNEEEVSRIIRDELEKVHQSLRTEIAELFRQHFVKGAPERND